MLVTKVENYYDNIHQLKVEHLYCDKCKAKFIKIQKRYGDGNFINVDSNIDFKDTECSICNNHKYDVDNIYKDRDELNKIIQNTVTDNKNTKLRAETVNKPLNQLWNITHAIGQYGYNKYNVYAFLTSKYALQCTKCGYIKITDADNLDAAGSTVCNCCKQKLVLSVNKKYDKILSDISADINRCKNYMEKQNSKKDVQDIQEVEKKDASAFTKMKQRFTKYNPNMQLLAAYKVDDLEKTLICCDLCGTPSEVSTHRIKELKNYECSGCKAQIENPNYLGLYKRDITNTTKNGLVCKEQNGDKVTLRCKYCGTVYPDKDKTKFLMGKIYCTKKEHCSSVDVFCPECFYSMLIKNKEINSKLVCPKCNTNVYVDAHNEIISTDAKIEINEGLRYLSSQAKKPVEFTKGIARTAEPLYRGNDNVDYYNCRCTIHNQSCILNEDEMNINPHKYCDNIHNIFIDEENIKKLKLNREASITEREEK